MKILYGYFRDFRLFDENEYRRMYRIYPTQRSNISTPLLGSILSLSKYSFGKPVILNLTVL